MSHDFPLPVKRELKTWFVVKCESANAKQNITKDDELGFIVREMTVLEFCKVFRNPSIPRLLCSLCGSNFSDTKSNKHTGGLF